MARARHYRTTTTYRGNGVTNRTVESRSGWWGPYKSPQEQRSNEIAIVTLIVFVVAVAWPWAITSIPAWERALIALAWYSLVIGVLVLGAWKGRRAKSTASTPTPATAAPQMPAVQPTTTQPTTTAPALTPDQVARAHEKVAKTIREQRASAAGPAAAATASSTPAPPATQKASPRQTKVVLTEAEKRDVEAKYDELMARKKAIDEHLAEYRRQKDQQE